MRAKSRFQSFSLGLGRDYNCLNDFSLADTNNSLEGQRCVSAMETSEKQVLDNGSTHNRVAMSSNLIRPIPSTVGDL
jgi:hypothetical protein